MLVEELVALLPADGSWLSKRRLLARLRGFSDGSPGEKAVRVALRTAERKGMVLTRGARDERTGVVCLEAARAWPRGGA